MGRRVAAFAVLALVCAGMTATYVDHAGDRGERARAAGAPGSTEEVPQAEESALASLGIRPETQLLAVSRRQGPDYERLTSIPLSRPVGGAQHADLRCARVHIAGGRGVCLVNDRNARSRSAAVFDPPGFVVLHQVPVEGIPSRVRVAPNGRVAAATSFVAGDSYAIDSFSTRTVFIDLDRGEVVTDLERFDVRREGRAFHPIDQNFWGVTFAADSDTFYATMRTGSHYYLIHGRLSTRRAEVLRDRVECPSLSPDGRVIVYKSRIEHGFQPATWQLRVLDLATLVDRPLGETRSVDDQAIWLDDAHVAYGVQDRSEYSSEVDVWVARADGTGAPELLVRSIDSPVLLE